MKISVEELKDCGLINQRLVYSGKTGNYIDVKVSLSPLEAVYTVGKSEDIYSDLESAVNRFNELDY